MKKIIIYVATLLSGYQLAIAAEVSRIPLDGICAGAALWNGFEELQAHKRCESISQTLELLSTNEVYFAQVQCQSFRFNFNKKVAPCPSEYGAYIEPVLISKVKFKTYKFTQLCSAGCTRTRERMDMLSNDKITFTTSCEKRDVNDSSTCGNDPNYTDFITVEAHVRP